MSTNKEERLADIAADMRGWAELGASVNPSMLLRYADRIDKATLIERADAATIAATQAVNLTDEKWKRDAGDGAKVREALAALVEYWTWGGYDGPREYHLKKQAKDALASKPRNCDKPEFADTEKALNALAERFHLGEELYSGFKVAVHWLLDTQDYCIANPVSRRFGQAPEKGE